MDTRIKGKYQLLEVGKSLTETNSFIDTLFIDTADESRPCIYIYMTASVV
jgi:hypothetical protein